MRSNIMNQRGFTLIEIMVVIVILSLLAVLVGPKLIGRTDDAKIQTTKTQIQGLQSALKLYRLDNGVYPATEQGLQALITKPTTGVIPRNYKAEGYIDSRSLPKDGWGNDFVYLSPGANGEYDLYSLGADGAKGGEGNNADIESWNLK